VIDELKKRVQDVLTASFNSPMTSTEPFLKGTRVLSGTVSALIYFAGQGLAGHVLVSAEEDHLRAIRGRILPKRCHNQDAAV